VIPNDLKGMTLRTGSKLLGLQYLRAVAALMVAYYHTRIQVPALTPYLQAGGVIDTDRLSFGVDIFFVLSGFVMMITSQDIRPGDFFVRRLIRVAPLYWLLTLVLAGIALVAPNLFRSTTVSVEYLVKSLLFIPYANPTQDFQARPILVPGWTLNMEMFFYAIFALALFAPRRLRLVSTGVVFGTLVTVGALLPHPASTPVLAFYTFSGISEFWIGMVLAELYSREALRMPMPVAVALIMLGFAVLLVPMPLFPDVRISNDIGSAAIVLGVVAIEQTRGIGEIPVLGILGDASYSLYLTHIFTLGLMRVIWAKVGWVSASGAAVFATLSLIACSLFAVASYRLVEKPVTRFLNKRRSAASQRSAASPVDVRTSTTCSGRPA
jgi:exopolysaccharide production protein ExoZ